MRRSFLAEHDVATFNLANTPPPVANTGLGSYSRALEFTSMALSSSETNNMKLMCRRFSADAIVRPSIDEDKPEDPLGRHVADHVTFIPKRRPSSPGNNTPSKTSEQHATKNGDISYLRILPLMRQAAHARACTVVESDTSR